MRTHKQRLIRLINRSGGEVSNYRFVEKPGVKLISKTKLTEDGKQLFDAMNIDQDRPDYEQSAEFNSRITYQSFNEEEGDSEEFNRKMVEDFGHLSVHSSYTATFLIAGVSIETCQELIAHTEASVSRLTSSRTKAQDDPLFRLTGTPEEKEMQKDVISTGLARVKDLRGVDLNKDERDTTNRLYPGAKVTALTYHMSIKDFHKTFIGRLSEHGVERDMRSVCEEMCEILHEEFPLVVKEPDHYYQLNNDDKYDME
jgi:thymidylate synthase ThyX